MVRATASSLAPVLLLLVLAAGGGGVAFAGATPGSGSPRCLSAVDRSIRWTVNCSGLALESPPPPVHLHPVAALDLSHNLIRRIVRAQFANFTELARLNLSFNSIGTVDDDSFYGLSNLLELNLAHNVIAVLSTDITNHLTKLKILNLSSNKLKTISSGAFHPVPMLVMLHLDGNNGLGTLPENYEELSEPLGRRLIFLDLANTSLTGPSEHFLNSTSLITLNIARNPLKTVPDMPRSLRNLNMSETLIEKLLPGDFEKHDDLQKLALENMPLLSKVAARALFGLNHLEELYIKNCPKLNFISENAFGETFPSLQKVVISNCSVETLRKTYEPLFKEVRYIDLQFNPWLCDGKTYWIVELNIYPNLTEELRCSKPDAAKGMLMADYFKPQARSFSSLVHAGVVIALLAVLVGGVVTLIRHMTKEEARRYHQIHQDICLQERPPNTLTPL